MFSLIFSTQLAGIQAGNGVTDKDGFEGMVAGGGSDDRGLKRFVASSELSSLHRCGTLSISPASVQTFRVVEPSSSIV